MRPGQPKGCRDLWVCGLLVLLIVWWSAPSMARPAPSVEQGQPGRAEYTVSLQAPQAILRHQEVGVMVQVQTRQGQPVNGVAVEFLLPAVWQRDASLLPARVMTQEGIARAVLWVDRVGVVQVIVRVGTVTKDMDIMVMTPLATPCWLMLGEMGQDDGSSAWPTRKRFRVLRVCRWLARAPTAPVSMAVAREGAVFVLRPAPPHPAGASPTRSRPPAKGHRPATS